jgi:NADP-dependent 3-hydroxy acid dehydrogenase YdfG
LAQAIRAEVHGAGVRVTTIQPGKVATPFFDGDPPPDCLEADDVVAAVRYAASQSAGVDVNEIVLRPSISIADRRATR